MLGKKGILTVQWSFSSSRKNISVSKSFANIVQGWRGARCVKNKCSNKYDDTYK